VSLVNLELLGLLEPQNFLVNLGNLEDLMVLEYLELPEPLY
jgi:hypothetical protein